MRPVVFFRIVFCILAVCLVHQPALQATIFGQVQGVVHDPQHRPICGATVAVEAAHSALKATATTDSDGKFAVPVLPLGDYIVTVMQAGFHTVRQTVPLASDTSPVLHFELPIAGPNESVTISTETINANPNSVTPTTLIGRAEIAETPGADRTNSLAMITDYVPGAYMTHDMLHMRGGHQVSWLLDGVQIPNTNIASNLGAQIDPKDIDYVEVQRGSYTSDIGDRTFGVFNVVPRTGFERNRDGEAVLTGGNYLQSSAQVSLGDHTERLAWYASVNGSRSDYGLSPPVGQVHHDADNSFGGFGSLIYNRGAPDQIRLLAQQRNDSFQIPYDPDPNSFGNGQFDSSGLRDRQHEADSVVAISWLHTFSPKTMLQVSPFYHRNRADYDGDPSDTPVATTSKRTSNYAGGQISASTEIARNTVQAGVYAFGQHDSYRLGSIFNDGSGTPGFNLPDATAGGVVEAFVSDNFRATDWLTLIAGVRQTHFQGQFTENETAPRVGTAIRIPRLNWVVRGFYGRFYQPPPLETAAGPVVQFAQANNTDFRPLHGERDEEHQFGVQIPFRGWVLDADTFKTRITNFLDHSNIGDSSIYYPVTVDGALVRAWELSLRSPRLGRFGQAHLAYSNQIAEQRGAITGGLICAPVSSPECDVEPGYTPVDHDQRNTLNVGFNATLPSRITGSTNVYYGSGFVNGNPDPATPYPNAYLPEHTTFDLAVSKGLGERTTVSVNALNVANRRVLLDNSLTFGGFHFNDPRQIYGEVRYRFHF